MIEVHFYDGNRGPLWHGADKIETAPTAKRKASSWFYKKAAGGGSLLDYLGYGTTLGTWFMNGRAPIEVTAVVDQPKGLEVDEHSVVVARYETGLSKFETRWGTFADPWKLQPQPKCGFVVVGTRGTLASYDYEPSVRLQTVGNPAERVEVIEAALRARKHVLSQNPAGLDVPVDVLAPEEGGPIAHVLHALAHGKKVGGPLSPKISRIGQQIVDSAVLSARLRKTVKLVD